MPCGWAVDLSGDVDGDGFDDVLLGGATVSLFLGGPAPAFDATADAFYDEPTIWAFGAKVAIVPDVDRDGDDEVLVGAPGSAAVLYLGAAGVPLDVTADATFVSLVPDAAPFDWMMPYFGLDDWGGDDFAASLAGVGDVTGDGYGDLVVGAPGTDCATGSPTQTHVGDVGLT